MEVRAIFIYRLNAKEFIFKPIFDDLNRCYFNQNIKQCKTPLLFLNLFFLRYDSMLPIG
jgi:hypothetical protein